MQKLGRFEILEEIGRGGCGIVYKAVDPRIGRHVALKTILPGGELVSLQTPRPKPATLVDITSTMRSPRSSLYQRLQIEAQSAGRLSHPNIVVIHELDEQDGTTFVVMEFVAGRTLAALMEDEQPTLDAALHLLRQTAAALDHAHESGVVHRDIKPANILVTSQSVVKVTDFGIAKVLQGEIHLTQTGAAMGTAYYMAPEQIEARPVSAQTDQFALGVIAFELLTGRRPFQGDSYASILHQILNVDPPPISDFRPDLSREVTAVLRRAMAKDASHRFATCREFLEHLTPAAKAAPDLTPTERQPPTAAVVEPARRSKMPRVLWLGTAAGVLVGLVGVWAIFRSSPHVELPAAPTPVVAQSVEPPPAPDSLPAATVTQASPKPGSQDKSKVSAKARPVQTAAEPAQPPPPQPSPPQPAPLLPQPVTPQQPTVAEAPVLPPAQSTPPPKPVEIARIPEPPPAKAVVAAPSISPDERAWAALTGTRSAAALEQFRKEYPNSPHAHEALELAERIEWESIRGSGDARVLNDFVARYPSGRFADDAREQLRRLDAAARSRQTRQLADATLERYRAAFEHRSLDELRRVWPGLTRQEQSTFQDFFRNARSLSMSLRPQGEAEISGDNVTVRALRSIQMTSERGREPAQENSVVIRLKRAGAELVIESISLQR